jgi:hypothetical protein
MILFFFFLFVFSFASPEAIVETLVGFLVSWGLTNYLKNQTGLAGLGATILAVIVCFVVAVVAVAVSTLFSGQEITLEAILNRMPMIFTLATLAYRTAKTAKGK